MHHWCSGNIGAFQASVASSSLVWCSIAKRVRQQLLLLKIIILFDEQKQIYCYDYSSTLVTALYPLPLRYIQQTHMVFNNIQIIDDFYL